MTGKDYLLSKALVLAKFDGLTRLLRMWEEADYYDATDRRVFYD